MALHLKTHKNNCTVVKIYLVEGVKMEVKFKRRIVNELLTTYLPSILLLCICYATTHFKSFYFEAAVTVNLTVMLVSTTLFIRSIYLSNNL